MRLARTMQIVVAGSLLSFTLAATPALANEPGPGGPPPPPVPPAGYAPAPYEEMAPAVRESWLAECRSRMGRHRGREAQDFCVRYLDDYYAPYRGAQPYGYQGFANGYPGYGYPANSAGCCQPMMMVPIMRVPTGRPSCKETVEYEYVDVPQRAPPPPRPAPRPAPDKRVKIAPDKRIPAQ